MKTDFLKKNLIAHRGVHYKYRENTIEAFRSAIRENYIIELDVHLTRDKKVIVYHDNNLKRITGINKEIKDSTYKELNNIIRIPTLENVLNLIEGRVPIIIETKFDNKIGLLEKELSKILDKYNYEFAIQSFNPLSILWFKLNRPKYIKGYLIYSVLPSNFLVKAILNSYLLNQIIKPDYIGININYLKTKKTLKLKRKYLIIGYTINNQKEYNKYKHDADNFICNIGKEPYK